MTHYNLYHPLILKRMNCSLVYTDKQQSYFGQYTQCFLLSDPPSDVAYAIRTARTIHVHPDGFDYWIDILRLLHEQTPLQVKLFLISGSDYPIYDSHIEYWTQLFPNARFWIQNYCGTHTQCTLFPIGVNTGREVRNPPKTQTLVISYFNELNSEERALLKQYIEDTPALHPYRIPQQSTSDYCDSLGNAKFSVCPTGNGFDTMRFWESLSEKTIPIVLQNDFTRNLSIQYPSLPVVKLRGWHELLEWSTQNLDELYDSILQTSSDFTPVSVEYWIQALENTLLTADETNSANTQG